MPSFNHVVETKYSPTFRTEKVAGMFDIPPADVLTKKWEVNFPVENVDWQIGLIVGPSGCGKTTLAKRIFGNEVCVQDNEWTSDSLLDDFDDSLSIKDITDALSHVGFSSPPAWLLPFRALSNGQKFRAELARVLLEKDKLVVFDEFTSVVDRTVAKIGSHAVQKFIRNKTNKQFVAVTCHADVETWLQPDWIYDVAADNFARGSLRQESLKFDIGQVHHKAWELFKSHHYMSADLNPAAKCFMATIDGQPAAFCAVLHMPHPKVKTFKKEHRTVVLPDFQGIGLGWKLSEMVANHFIDIGFRFISITSHPAVIGHRIKSSQWKMTRKPSRLSRRKTNVLLNKAASFNRLTASFEYVGGRGKQWLKQEGQKHK
jgi:ABC-type polar amino acid transport system ATPase subunit/GNAT superfamily N-acetyltransferase